MTNSLYERLGGAEAVDRVSPFFDSTDMEAQKRKQRSFLIFAFGGPNNYDGKNMRDAHAHLLAKGLNDSHVDIVIEHLGNTLTELGVCNEDVQEVATIANSVRDDILSRPSAA